MKEFLKDSSTL